MAMSKEQLAALWQQVRANPHLNSARQAGLEGLETICNEINKELPPDQHVTEDDLIMAQRATR